MSVVMAARACVERAAAAGQRGRVAAPDDLARLVEAFAGRYPGWLADLVAAVPLAGLRLGWADPPPRSADDIRWLVWSGPREVRLESLETGWPGRLVLPLGYVNVGLDGSDGGDPYFVRADGNPDPPVWRVFHDGGSSGEELAARARLIAPSLSGFFRAALVRVPPELEDEDAEPDVATDPAAGGGSGGDVGGRPGR